MDSAEARKVLALYRPGITDDSDPPVAEALAAVRRDSELAAWFEQHCATYLAIRGKLKSLPIPGGLRRQIIAGQPAASPFLPMPSWVIATVAAAALVLLTALVWYKFIPSAEDTFTGYRDRMARMVQRDYPMPMVASDQVQVRKYFAGQGTPADYVLPAPLDKLPAEGGVATTWNTNPVSLLCLNGSTRPGITNDLYLFIADRSAVPHAPQPGAGPEFKMVSTLMTVSWSAGNRLYLLAGRGDEATLRKYIE